MSPEARLQIDFILLSLVLFGVSCFLTVLLDSLQSLSPSLPPSPFEERNTLLIKEREGEECTGRAAEPRPFSWTGWNSLTFPLRIAKKSFLGHLVSEAHLRQLEPGPVLLGLLGLWTQPSGC